MNIRADFTRITGTVKPMHGVGQPPFLGLNDRFMHYIGEAGIPYSRLHDVGGAYGGSRFVDIPNIFPDFDADENDPASYHFAFTDWLMAQLNRQSCEAVYRLGVTIEGNHAVEARHIYPPKDFEKWARICEHIIMHYNEGWANGFHYGVKYWEIWNEPEGELDGRHRPMWLGTQEEFFRLYETASRYLKARFGDSIRIGGYAACGYFNCLIDPDCLGFEHPKNNFEYWMQYTHDFLRYVSSEEHKCPLEFFSWHLYGDVHEILASADYCRKALDKYGFHETEDMLNEWNIGHTHDYIGTPRAAAHALAVMLGMQKKSACLLAYYDARIGASQYSGLFNAFSWSPLPAYYAFMSFNQAYRLGNEVETSSDHEKVFVLGACNEKKKVLLIANISAEPVEAEFALTGASLTDHEILMIDSIYQYTPTGKQIMDNQLILPAYSCVEIRFDD